GCDAPGYRRERVSMKKEVGLFFRILLALVVCGANVYRAYLEGGVKGVVFGVVISILLVALLIIYRLKEMSMKKEVGLLILSFMHGLLITRMNMQPFIVTLCGLLFYRGLARFITKDETKGFGTVGGLDFLRYLANGNLFGIPMPFVLLIIISLITWVLLHWSVYGRYLFATGRNAEAARYAGINTR